MRLFISIDPPANVCQQIARLRSPLKGYRLPAVDQLHLTLLFLSEQPSDSVERIENALNPLNKRPFVIELQGIGMFRSGVIWIGVDNNPVLMALQKQLCHALTTQNLVFQQRKYHPHLTLARTGKRTDKLLFQRFAEPFSEQHFSFTAEKISLKQSILSPEGAQHITLHEWPLI